MANTPPIRQITLQDLKDWLCETDHEHTVLFEDPDYVTAVVGITDEGRLIYDYDKMAEYLMRVDGMDIDEAYEFIDVNTIRDIPYFGPMAPIISYPLNGVI